MRAQVAELRERIAPMLKQAAGHDIAVARIAVPQGGLGVGVAELPAQERDGLEPENLATIVGYGRRYITHVGAAQESEENRYRSYKSVVRTSVIGADRENVWIGEPGHVAF